VSRNEFEYWATLHDWDRDDDQPEGRAKYRKDGVTLTVQHNPTGFAWAHLRAPYNATYSSDTLTIHNVLTYRQAVAVLQGRLPR
jgi:hypothetical protein